VYKRQGLGWVRLFVDSDGERYHQWMRSNTSEIFAMNKEHHTNGTFFVSNLSSEFYHRTSSFSFDYFEWLKEDYLKNKSPAEQIKSKAVRSYEVQCKEGLELILKISDNSPACVKSQTVEKLITRGWTNP